MFWLNFGTTWVQRCSQNRLRIHQNLSQVASFFCFTLGSIFYWFVYSFSWIFVDLLWYPWLSLPGSRNQGLWFARGSRVVRAWILVIVGLVVRSEHGTWEGSRFFWWSRRCWAWVVRTPLPSQLFFVPRRWPKNPKNEWRPCQVNVF